MRHNLHIDDNRNWTSYYACGKVTYTFKTYDSWYSEYGQPIDQIRTYDDCLNLGVL
jgi:hypothetical protein